MISAADLVGLMAWPEAALYVARAARRVVRVSWDRSGRKTWVSSAWWREVRRMSATWMPSGAWECSQDARAWATAR